MDERWSEGKVAAVTGGASGIGRAIALKLARAGARVVVSDVDLPRAEAVASEARSCGVDAVAARVDVTREEDAAALVRKALERYGRLDFLANSPGPRHSGPVLEMSDEDWARLIDGHLTGTFLVSRAAIDALTEAGGRIVSMSSSYGFKGRQNGAHYSAAKAGIVALTKVLALELAPRVNANAIAPGPIDTPGWRGSLSDNAHEKRKAERTRDVPLGRMGRAEDIAEAAAFLFGPGSDWITGQVLHVNGGEFLP